jgi:hypothetical protein
MAARDGSSPPIPSAGDYFRGSIVFKALRGGKFSWRSFVRAAGASRVLDEERSKPSAADADRFALGAAT